MICLASLEHDRWLADPENRLAHLAYCMDVGLPIPPLCITETELRDGLQILDEVLEIADEM